MPLFLATDAEIEGIPYFDSIISRFESLVVSIPLWDNQLHEAMAIFLGSISNLADEPPVLVH